MAGTSKTVESNGVLCITERWIRDHLNLQKDALDDVRSISLPGSYYEKITHLGRSLVRFTRLKHLDLSRNALESLEGLEHLKHLETLNVYYNSIGTLSELFRLRHNKKLKDLDVRLNPVTKNEPDYRLFMVHMLVNLRKLDDRGVRDSERRAALLHFNTDQAHLFEKSAEVSTPRVEPPQHGVHSKHLSSRKDLVKSLAPRPSCLDTDTDELLDLISQRDQPSTSSQLHTPLSHLQTTPPAHHSLYDRVQTTPPYHPSYEELKESNLRVTGHFTPAPGGNGLPVQTEDEREKGVLKVATGHQRDIVSAALEDLLGFMQWFVDGDLGPLKKDSEFREKFGDWLRAHLPSPSHLHFPHSSQRDEELHKLEEDFKHLEDKMEATVTALEDKNSEIVQLKTQLEQGESETTMLSQQLEETRTKLTTQLSQHKHSIEELQQQLQQASREKASLQEHIHGLQRENISLRTTLDQAPPTSHMDSFKEQIRELESERNSLRVELDHAIERQVQEADTSTQLQQLVVMLQESHRSLVATNSHLLQELEESKQRHSQEVSQMNINYEHLRKTIDSYI